MSDTHARNLSVLRGLRDHAARWVPNTPVFGSGYTSGEVVAALDAAIATSSRSWREPHRACHQCGAPMVIEGDWIWSCSTCHSWDYLYPAMVAEKGW